MKTDPLSETGISKSSIDSSDISQLLNITLFFFAYRDFIADADKELKEIGFGRAHHRILFFVCLRPGMNVAELLQILRITKQSLARVLRQMISSGHIIQKTGTSDRRRRLLFPTSIGRKLILSLSQAQSRRLSNAIKSSHMKKPEHLSQFLDAMIDPSERDLVTQLLSSINKI